jgi:DNA polymerase I
MPAERLGVPPQHVVDYLALIGDSSDNIPGAKGIGPKTAIQLIEQYGSVEEILAHAEEVSNKRAREALIASADDVRLSRELVTIQDDLPVELDLERCACREPDRERCASCSSSSSSTRWCATTGREETERRRSGATTRRACTRR